MKTIKVGEKFFGRPIYQGAQECPKGYELFSHYRGWEEGEGFFLAPIGAKFQEVVPGNPHRAPVWERIK